MVNLALKALLLANAVAFTTADIATWPSSSDELEDLMVLNSGFSARNFPGPLVPCNSNRVPGFSIAGGFLRTAFHDMAPANVAAGTGGLDASIGFELDNPYAFANRGPAFNNTVTYLSQFYNGRVSMADLIALGTYASVRSCGGPIVPIRGGRIDATQAGELGVPDARDNGDSMTQSFNRMGLTQAEGIELVACGHTLGAVHTSSFPSIVPDGSTAVGNSDFDTTNSTYDNKVVTQYLDGTTKNPLVMGPDTLAQSDFRVFNLDNNVTVTKMADANVYSNTCATILQKMIDTVPSGVKLTNPITPYDIKPSLLQLTLSNDDELAFTGQLRLKLNGFSKSDVSKVQLIYKDREGKSSCGDCKIDASEVGEASGFDDEFVTSISAFNVIVTFTSGSAKTYDNNGNGYPVQDKVFVQAPNSSLAATDASGNQKLTVVALVRNGGSDATLTVSTITPLVFNKLPTTSKSSVSMTKGCKTTYYTYYSATFDLPSASVATAKFDVSSGSDSDSFKSPANLPAGSAVAFSCGGNGTSTTTSGIYHNSTTSTGYGKATTSTSTSTASASGWNDWKWPVPSASADPGTDGEIDWSSKKNTTVIVIVNENWIGDGSNYKDTHNSGIPEGYSSTSTASGTGSGPKASASGTAKASGTHSGNGTATGSGIIAKYTGAASAISVSASFGLTAALFVASVLCL